ncbi:hypothetical protein DFA_02796 [Cavenderia fasciculata]|uniref:Uncharacterized protein n=1 Tax=Cavenderia fasciculata TaxID=261658 RepID=F4PIB9_CACFS|nr:uncharacterized protein DFA_02796 [Cavenderia fasciculata]EGG24553.1 hypothetical protein DFA_02796 [Cavenderia fasciculata]|eukprot:XP_004362404.1 hypothetical protein DFA_02796 [Cavenderia fasciculata]
MILKLIIIGIILTMVSFIIVESIQLTDQLQQQHQQRVQKNILTRFFGSTTAADERIAYLDTCVSEMVVVNNNDCSWLSSRLLRQFCTSWIMNIIKKRCELRYSIYTNIKGILSKP